jgi:hypothetical protein
MIPGCSRLILLVVVLRSRPFFVCLVRAIGERFDSTPAIPETAEDEGDDDDEGGLGDRDASATEKLGERSTVPTTFRRYSYVRQSPSKRRRTFARSW